MHCSWNFRGDLDCARNPDSSVCKKLYREYKEIAETSNDGFIPDMAAILNQPEDKVRRNLEKLCKKKYFNDAYVDNKAKVICSKGSDESEDW